MALRGRSGDADVTGDPLVQIVESEMSGLWDILSSRRPLPMRFALHPSRRPSNALCPCLEVDLPAFGHLRSGGRTAARNDQSFTVTRILDPEHKVPYISLSPLFLAAGLSTLQGLFLLSLDPNSDYDLSLAGLEPWDDVWVSLKLATHISKEFGVYPPLSALLDPRTRLAWSLDEGERGISHNWRVPAELLDPATYSTDTLLASSGFAKIHILQDGEQLTTLVSGQQRQQVEARASESPRNGSRLHEKLVRWSTMCYSVSCEMKLARAKLLESQHDAGEDGESAKTARLALARCVLQDIDIHSISPTLPDLQEWLQLSMPAGLDVEAPATLPELAGLTLTQRIRVKQLDVGSGRSLNQKADIGAMDETDCLDLLNDLELLVRARMRSLHLMQLFDQQGKMPFKHLLDRADRPADFQSDTPAADLFIRRKASDSYQYLLDSIEQAVQRSTQKQGDIQAISDKDIQTRIGSLHQKFDDLCLRLEQSNLQSTLRSPDVESSNGIHYKGSDMNVSSRPKDGNIKQDQEVTNHDSDKFLYKDSVSSSVLTKNYTRSEDPAPSRSLRSNWRIITSLLPYLLILYLVFRLVKPPSELCSERELCACQCKSSSI